MRLNSYFYGLLACAALSACSSDNEVSGDNPKLTGGDSYVAIQLVAANGGSSRAEVGSPDEFDNGTADEGAVANANFYFYDKDGNFVVKGRTLGTLTTTEQPDGGNVERISDVTVVLENVTATPAQVLAVLNLPAGTDPFNGIKLADAQKKMVEGATGYGYVADDKQYFTMTNSTYLDGTVKCATPVETKHLQSSPDLAKANPVDIYVERLAAKVEVTNSVTSPTVDGINVNGDSKTMSIEVVGWGLNAVNKSSYYLKKIDSGWDTDFTWIWNKSDYHRSYWAEDPNYTDGTYPTSFNNLETVTEDAASLEYRSWSDIKKATGAQYCLENTLGTDILSNYMTAATHVLVLAQMKVSGETDYSDLYNYKGVFYEEEDYINTVLNDLTSTVTISKQDATDNTKYVSIEAADVEIVNKGDGKVNLKLTADALAKDWYKKDNTSKFTDKELDALFDDINSAEAYKDGMMYYSVPIEHLAKATVDTDDLEVGDLGVVRNHYYQLTITKIENLGKGVYEPTEIIVPNYDPETYYLAARLNILSWHIVKQTVNL